MEIDRLFENIRRDFIYTDKDITAMILFISLFIFILLFSNWLIVFGGKKRIADKYRKSFNNKIRELDLTINEIDLLNTLSGYLKHPWKKYLLMTNHQTLSRCLEKYRNENDSGSSFVDSLYYKINNSLVNPAELVQDETKPVKHKDNRIDWEEASKNTKHVYIMKEHGEGEVFKADVLKINQSFIIIKKCGCRLRLREDLRLQIPVSDSKKIWINGEVKGINKLTGSTIIALNHIKSIK